MIQNIQDFFENLLADKRKLVGLIAIILTFILGASSVLPRMAKGMSLPKPPSIKIPSLAAKNQAPPSAFNFASWDGGPGWNSGPLGYVQWLILICGLTALYGAREDSLARSMGQGGGVNKDDWVLTLIGTVGLWILPWANIPPWPALVISLAPVVYAAWRGGWDWTPITVWMIMSAFGMALLTKPSAVQLVIAQIFKLVPVNPATDPATAALAERIPIPTVPGGALLMPVNVFVAAISVQSKMVTKTILVWIMGVGGLLVHTVVENLRGTQKNWWGVIAVVAAPLFYYILRVMLPWDPRVIMFLLMTGFISLAGLLKGSPTLNQVVAANLGSFDNPGDMIVAAAASTGLLWPLLFNMA